MAFADMHAAMDNAELFVKHVVSRILSRHQADLSLFEQHYDKSVFDRYIVIVYTIIDDVKTAKIVIRAVCSFVVSRCNCVAAGIHCFEVSCN